MWVRLYVLGRFWRLVHNGHDGCWSFPGKFAHMKRHSLLNWWAQSALHAVPSVTISKQMQHSLSWNFRAQTTSPSQSAICPISSNTWTSSTTFLHVRVSKVLSFFTPSNIQEQLKRAKARGIISRELSRQGTSDLRVQGPNPIGEMVRFSKAEHWELRHLPSMLRPWHARRQDRPVLKRGIFPIDSNFRKYLSVCLSTIPKPNRSITSKMLPFRILYSAQHKCRWSNGQRYVWHGHMLRSALCLEILT